MQQEETAITIFQTPTSAISHVNDMTRSATLAEQAYHQNNFANYLNTCSSATKRRKQNDLANFCKYLALAGTVRTPEQLLSDPHMWAGINLALVAGFKQWLVDGSYRYTTINAHLATIRSFCKLCGPVEVGGVGILDMNTLLSIQTVKDISHKVAINIDEDRRSRGQATKVGRKKEEPTSITIEQSIALRKKSTDLAAQPAARSHDRLLSARDRLLTCLMLEHALRVSEVRALDIEHINLAAGTMSFYRPKTRTTETHKLQAGTLAAAGTYLQQIKLIELRTTGALFTGYQGKRITTAALNLRVGQLGDRQGIDALSPHDLRHEWTVDALRNGTSVDRVQSGGGWTSGAMVLRYAKKTGIANAGVKITNVTEE